MPRPVENIPAELEEHPVLSPALSQTAYDWPEELLAHLEAEVAAMRAATVGGDAA